MIVDYVLKGVPSSRWPTLFFAKQIDFSSLRQRHSHDFLLHPVARLDPRVRERALLRRRARAGGHLRISLPARFH